jgi:ABC-type multidrug transport system fused ATPase/permease subunit
MQIGGEIVYRIPSVTHANSQIAFFTFFFMSFNVGRAQAAQPDQDGGRKAARRVFKLIDEPSGCDIRKTTERQVKMIDYGKIEFKDVTF